MKNHLKRNAAPRTWLIARKVDTFIARPQPSGHTLKLSLPLGVVLRDMLKVASTMRELKGALNRGAVLVDGQICKNTHRAVGLFDVVSLVASHQHFRVVLDSKGRLKLALIPLEEAGIKICNVVSKTAVRDGKIQIGLHDGRSLVTADKVMREDAVVIAIPATKIKNVLALKPGQLVYLFEGRYAGALGKVKDIVGNKLFFESKGVVIETRREYSVVVGEEKPLITVGVHE